MQNKIIEKVKSLFNVIVKTRITTVAAAWVYYFLLALVPLAFLLVEAFNVFGIDVFAELLTRLPEEFKEIGYAVLQVAENASKTLTLFFVITVVFSVSSLIGQMAKDGEYIYGIKSKLRKGIVKRLSSVIALAVLFLTFLCAGLLFSFGGRIFSGISPFEKSGKFLVVFIFAFVILFCYAVLVLLNGFISPIKLNASALCLGGLISLFICVAGTIAFVLYLRLFSGYNAFYGSLAGIVAFLLWSYILMLGIAAGPLFCAITYQKQCERKKIEVRC